MLYVSSWGLSASSLLTDDAGDLGDARDADLVVANGADDARHKGAVPIVVIRVATGGAAHEVGAEDVVHDACEGATASGYSA